MGLMTKMRDSMPVVFAVLAGIFLLTIIFDWGGQGYIFKKTFDGQTLGTVNGRKITVHEYDRLVSILTENQKAQSKKSDLTEDEIAQVQDRAWDALVEQAIIKGSMEKLGITVSDQEIAQELFYNPPPSIRQMFTDSLGVFHEKEYFQALRDKRNDSLVRTQLEEPMREQLLNQKWQTVMTSVLRVTNAELANRFDVENRKANIQFAMIPPTGAPRDFFQKVSDDDIRKYYESHQYLYKRDEWRKIRFVMFQQTPTSRDSALAQDRMELVRKKLAAAPADKVDSVARELTAEYGGGIPYQQGARLSPRDYAGMKNASEIANISVGQTIILPPPQPGVGRVLSISDTGTPFFHYRTILVAYGASNNRDSARTFANGLISQIKGGAKFEDVAQKYSQDPSSAGKGGDKGWLPKPEIPIKVNTVLASAAPGQLYTVEDEDGIQVIELLAQTRKDIVIAAVPMPVTASSQTKKIVQQQAQVFREQAEKNGLEPAAKAAGYRILDDAPPITKTGQPIFGSKPFVNWVFDASKGDISEPIKIPAGNLFVVSQLVDIFPAGVKQLDDVKDQIRATLARQMRVAAIASKAQSLRGMLQPGDDLAKLKSSDTTLRVDTVTLGPAESVPQIGGTEYAVNIAAFKLKPGEISQPIKGENAYFIVKLNSVTEPSKEQFATAAPTLRATILRDMQQKFIMQWLQKQKESATIEDFRNQNH